MLHTIEAFDDPQFDWEEIETGSKIAPMKASEIAVSYKKDPAGGSLKGTLYFRIGIDILKHLEVNPLEDKVMILTDKNDPHNYLLIKSPNGRKLGKSGRTVWIMYFKYSRRGLKYFNSTICTTFLNRNKTVRVVFPK